MASIDEIKRYNARLASSKQAVQNLKIELEVRCKEATSIMQQLSAELGVEVTAENAMELYSKYKADLEMQLANGNSILDRLESGMNGGTKNGDTANAISVGSKQTMQQSKWQQLAPNQQSAQKQTQQQFEGLSI